MMEVKNPFYVEPIKPTKAQIVCQQKRDVRLFLQSMKAAPSVSFDELRAGVPSVAALDDTALESLLIDASHDNKNILCVEKDGNGEHVTTYEKLSFEVVGE